MSSFLTTDSIDQTPLFVCYNTQSQIFNAGQKICATLERMADTDQKICTMLKRMADAQHDASAIEVKPLISKFDQLNAKIMKMVNFIVSIADKANSCHRDEIDTRAILKLAIADCRATIDRLGAYRDRLHSKILFSVAMQYQYKLN